MTDTCPHECVENNTCMDCGWAISSFDSHGMSEFNPNYRSTVEYVSVLEVELSRMLFDSDVKERVLTEIRKTVEHRQGSRRQMMYAIILVVHLQMKKPFDYDRWERYYVSKRQDITVPLKLASGLLGRPVTNALAEIIVVSPVREVAKVTEILGLTNITQNVCDLMERCLAHERDLYEEKPLCTAVAFVKYYIQIHGIRGVTNIATKCGATPSVINTIVSRIKAVISEMDQQKKA